MSKKVVKLKYKELQIIKHALQERVSEKKIVLEAEPTALEVFDQEVIDKLKSDLVEEEALLVKITDHVNEMKRIMGK